MAGYNSFRSIGAVMANVNTTGLRTALRRRNLGAELPLLTDSGHRGGSILPFPNRTLNPIQARVSSSLSYYICCGPE